MSRGEWWRAKRIQKLTGWLEYTREVCFVALLRPWEVRASAEDYEDALYALLAESGLLEETAPRPARTFPFGTTRRATIVYEDGFYVFCQDDRGEWHILIDLGDWEGVSPKQYCDVAVGDTGVITFTEGGPLDGYWQFTKDGP